MGYSHFIDKCVQLDSSLPSANYDSAVQACNTVDTVIFQPRGYLIAIALGKAFPSRVGLAKFHLRILHDQPLLDQVAVDWEVGGCGG